MSDEIYVSARELIRAEEHWEKARYEADQIIEAVIKKKTGLDVQIGTFIDCEDVYFEIQNMMGYEIDKYAGEIEKATNTERRINEYSFYFNENRL